MSRIELTAVWPLTEGLVGIHPTSGGPTPLHLHTKGWMDWPDAIQARDAGDLQIMIQESPQSLKYTTKVMQPVVDLEPEIPPTAPTKRPRLSRKRQPQTQT